MSADGWVVPGVWDADGIKSDYAAMRQADNLDLLINRVRHR